MPYNKGWLTLPKSLTSKRSKGSNSSLLRRPSFSWHTFRKVRIFFRHRNCREKNRLKRKKNTIYNRQAKSLTKADSFTGRQAAALSAFICILRNWIIAFARLWYVFMTSHWCLHLRKTDHRRVFFCGDCHKCTLNRGMETFLPIILLCQVKSLVK